MFESLLAPWQFEIMRDGLWLCLSLAVLSGLLSPLVILKRWSMMGDAVSHAVLPGIGVAYWLGLPLAFGAFAAGLVCALGSGYITQTTRLKPDTVLGVVFSGMFALGIVLISLGPVDVHLDTLLLGSLLGVTPSALWQAAGVAVFAVVLMLLFWRRLMLVVFDRRQAQALGLKVTHYDYGLITAVALTVVLSLQSVGLVLCIAFLIAPGAIAYLWVDRFAWMIYLSVAVALLCGFLGLVVSFHLNSAPGASIVLCFMGVFLLTFVASPKYGLWRKFWHKKRPLSN